MFSSPGKVVVQGIKNLRRTRSWEQSNHGRAHYLTILYLFVSGVAFAYAQPVIQVTQTEDPPAMCSWRSRLISTEKC